MEQSVFKGLKNNAEVFKQSENSAELTSEYNGFSITCNSI